MDHGPNVLHHVHWCVPRCGISVSTRLTCAVSALAVFVVLNVLIAIISDAYELQQQEMAQKVVRKPLSRSLPLTSSRHANPQDVDIIAETALYINEGVAKLTCSNRHRRLRERLVTATFSPGRGRRLSAQLQAQAAGYVAPSSPTAVRAPELVRVHPHPHQ